MPGSANPYSGGMEKMAHLSGLNMSRSVLSPVFKNPILLPSFGLAFNQLWTDMVVKKVLSHAWGVYFLKFHKGSRHFKGFLNLSSVLASYWGKGGKTGGGGGAGNNRHDILFNFLGVFLISISGQWRGSWIHHTVVVIESWWLRWLPLIT